MHGRTVRVCQRRKMSWSQLNSQPASTCALGLRDVCVWCIACCLAVHHKRLQAWSMYGNTGVSRALSCARFKSGCASFKVKLTVVDDVIQPERVVQLNDDDNGDGIPNQQGYKFRCRGYTYTHVGKHMRIATGTIRTIACIMWYSILYIVYIACEYIFPSNCMELSDSLYVLRVVQHTRTVQFRRWHRTEHDSNLDA